MDVKVTVLPPRPLGRAWSGRGLSADAGLPPALGGEVWHRAGRQSHVPRSFFFPRCAVSCYFVPKKVCHYTKGFLYGKCSVGCSSGWAFRLSRLVQELRCKMFVCCSTAQAWAKCIVRFGVFQGCALAVVACEFWKWRIAASSASPADFRWVGSLSLWHGKNFFGLWVGRRIALAVIHILHRAAARFSREILRRDPVKTCPRCPVMVRHRSCAGRTWKDVCKKSYRGCSLQSQEILQRSCVKIFQ